MRNLKKFLALVLAMIMVVSAAAVVSADFTDVTADNRYADAINDLAVKGIVKGTTETTFGPTQDVQRYQMALFMARALTGNLDDADYQTGIVPFTDVTEYAGAIEYNYVNGIINGIGNNLFAPNAGIKYAEALKMAVCALDYAPVEGYDWPWNYYNKAAELGLTANMDVDSHDAVLNRAETAQIIYNMLYAVPADGGLSLAERVFDIQTAANTTTFVITATPKQYYAEENTTTDSDKYTSASDVEGEYVGIQKLVGGLPTGNMLFYTCEELGIPAADVEDYFNRAVELVNFDEAAKTFTSAVLGDAPKTVTYADVTEYKAGTTNANKLTIDGTIYTADKAITGATLINEIVIYEGNTKVEDAEMLVIDKDGKVHATVFYTVEGEDGEEYTYSQVENVGEFLYESAAGVKYFWNYATGETISESQAYKLGWGVKVIDEAAKFAKLQAISASALYNEAYELDLYDDDRDGLYERAVYTPIYMGIYYTFVDTVNKETTDVDGLVYENTGDKKAADAITYTDEAAQAEGAISVYTYNPQLNIVDVIDVLEVQTAELKKIDARSFDAKAEKATSTNNTVKLTLGENVYTLAYDMEDPTPESADKEKWSVQGAQLGAEVIELPGAYDVTELDEDPVLDLYNDKDELEAFVETAELGELYAYVEYNGYVIMATKVLVDEVYNYAVVSEFEDFDLGEIYLDLYIAGELEELCVVTEIAGYDLANIKNSTFTKVLSKEDLFYPGTVYTLEIGEDGSAALEKKVTKSNYALRGLLDAKVANDDFAAGATVDAENTLTIVFDNGKSDSSDKLNMLRTDSETVFYFIEDKTWADLTKAEKNKLADDGITELNWLPTPEDVKISVYVGEPEDEAFIEFDDETQIWTDKIGRGTAKTNGVANVVFVIDPVAHDFFAVDSKEVWVLMTVSTKSTTATVEAAELGLDPEKYAEEYYAYYGDFVNMDTGAKIGVVYSEEKITKKGSTILVKIDENGVVTSDNYLWNDTNVVTYNNAGVRDYAYYGIVDCNTVGALGTSYGNWGKADNKLDYYDWLYAKTMKQRNVPKNILDVEMAVENIEIDKEDGYYVIENGVGNFICDEYDRITTIKVVDISALGTVLTDADAVEYLEHTPAYAYIAGSYFKDGCIVFVTATKTDEGSLGINTAVETEPAESESESAPAESESESAPAESESESAPAESESESAPAESESLGEN